MEETLARGKVKCRGREELTKSCASATLCPSSTERPIARRRRRFFHHARSAMGIMHRIIKTFRPREILRKART